nr:MAG TPA: hypothetical protein [Caudoviricetes sp.]
MTNSPTRATIHLFLASFLDFKLFHENFLLKAKLPLVLLF